MIDLQNLLFHRGRTTVTEIIYTLYTMPYQKLPTNALAQPPSHQKDHADANEGGQARSHGCTPAHPSTHDKQHGDEDHPGEQQLIALRSFASHGYELWPLTALQGRNVLFSWGILVAMLATVVLEAVSTNRGHRRQCEDALLFSKREVL